MAIKHAKVSGVADGGDATLVRPSDWNADHTIDDGSIALSKLANMATDKLLGRDTVGAGAPEEVAVTGGLEFTAAGGIRRGALTGDVDAPAGSAVVEVFQASKDFALPGDISPPALTANQNDWNPGSLADAAVIRLSATNGPVTITGLAGGADGRLLFLHNTGSVPICFQREATASAAANRFDFRDSVWLGEDEILALQYDSTASRWRKFNPTGLGQLLASNPTQRLVEVEDFQQILWGGVNSGTGAQRTSSAYGIDGTSKAAGVVSIETGTTSTGRCTMSAGVGGVSTLVGGLGVAVVFMRVAVQTLSAVAEEFIAGSGFLDNTGAGDHTDGVYFEYDRLASGDFWKTVTAVGGVRTKNVTNVAVTTGYIWLAFVVNAAWTRVTFMTSTDGETWTVVDTGDHTTNIPGTAALFFPGIKIQKSAGITTRLFHVDAAAIAYEYRRGL